MKKHLIKAAIMCLTLIGSTNVKAQSLQDILGGIAGATTSKSGGSDLISGLTSIFSSKNNANAKNIVGTWEYTEPAILLTSDNMLTNIAAKAASEKLESQIQTYLTKYGIKPGAMSITFTEDGKFSEKLGKKTTNGTWQIKDGKLIITYGTIKPVSITTQIEGKNLLITTGANQLLNMMKTFGANSTNTTISSITKLMKTVNGMQCGLTFVKK